MVDTNQAQGSNVAGDTSDKVPVSDFVSQVQSHIDESEKVSAEVEKKKEAPPVVSGPGNPAPQHLHLIDSARKFNENLQRPPAMYGIPYPINVNPSVVEKIRMVLKDNGMDSQQQEKALHRIGLILLGREE